MATQIYAKKWLIYGSYTLQPKEIWANCGLAVNMCVGFLLGLNQLKNRRNLRQITYFCTSFNSQKLVFFMPNISKHTDQSVCHEKTYL